MYDKFNDSNINKTFIIFYIQMSSMGHSQTECPGYRTNRFYDLEWACTSSLNIQLYFLHIDKPV